MDFALKHIIILTIIIGTIFVIISENRNPIKTIAWCLVLAFMPVVGLILYILFGMDSRHRRMIKDEELTGLKTITERVQNKEIASDIPDCHKPLTGMLKTMNRAYPLGGNNVEIITDFQTMSDRLIADIEGAMHHINLLFFKFEDDEVGRRIADALIRKAEQGVQVRLIYDDAGNLMVPRKFYRRLRKHGIQVRGFIRIFLPILSRDFRFGHRFQRSVLYESICADMAAARSMKNSLAAQCSTTNTAQLTRVIQTRLTDRIFILRGIALYSMKLRI